MKKTLLIAVIAGSISGVGGAFVAKALQSERPATARSASIDPTVDIGSLDGIVARLDSMEKRIDTLAIQPASAAADTRSSLNSQSAIEMASLREELAKIQKLTKVLEKPTSADVPIDLQLQVASAIENIEEQKDAERVQRREEAFATRLEERLAMVAKELGLSPYQSDELRRLETENRTKRDTLMAEARKNEDWGSMRDTMRTLRDEQETSLTDLFGDDLYSQYDELVGRGGLAGGGGGRGNQGGGQGGAQGGGRRGGR